LDAWRTQAATSEIASIVRFSEGLQDDLAAIQAGLTLPWSHGVTEGQINRLKLDSYKAINGPGSEMS
jgi:transposase